jgi:hypothetical protein
MNHHILADYSARLREPEVLSQIRAMLRSVAAEATPPVPVLYILTGPQTRRRSQLRGSAGMRLMAHGFRLRDVAELFGQNQNTTAAQINTARRRIDTPL